MKRSIWISAITCLLLSGAAAANPLPWTQIGLYGDPAGTVSVVYDVVPGLIELYVVQTVYMEPVGAVRFAARPPMCFTATYLGEEHFHTTAGNSQTGAWVFYGPCVVGSVHVMTIRFSGHGTSCHCCRYGVQPYPGSCDIESQMCGGSEWLWTHGVGIYISAVPGDNCDSPVEQSTWSAIKAMYR